MQTEKRAKDWAFDTPTFTGKEKEKQNQDCGAPEANE